MTTSHTRRGFTQRCFAKGFTLIELLVVVLIIGILTAVAVPQYKKATLKNRFSALMPIGNALAESNEVYYLESGEYATNLEGLVVQAQSSYPDGMRPNLVDSEEYSYVQVSNEDKLPNNHYLVFQKHSTQFADTTMCEAADEVAGQLCESFGGVALDGGVTSGWTAYLLSGDPGDSSFKPKGVVFNSTVYSSNLDVSTFHGEVTFDAGGRCNGQGSGCSSTEEYQFVFTNGALCSGNMGNDCNGNVYDGGRCMTDVGGSCNNSTFTNNSVCTSYCSTCCRGTYDATSRCEGPACPTNCTDNGDGTRTCS